MKKTFTKILAVVVCVVMTLTAAPLGGFVGLELPSLFNFEAEAATYSGTCGDNLKWALNTSTGVLNITGTGAMTNYSTFSSVPWYSYCSYIKSVNIGNSVTSIGNYAFYGCTTLTSVTIPDSVTTIGNYAFCMCCRLTCVTIPDSVTSIGNYAFDNCTSLTSVTIGNSVKTIGDDAFFNCSSLTSITIPNSVTEIGEESFAECWRLTNVEIGNNVHTIGVRAFWNCISLNSITIPNSVKIISERAFFCNEARDAPHHCDVYYSGSKAQWQKISIGSYNEELTSATIHFNTSNFENIVSENIDYYIKYNDHDYRRVTINATIADSSFSQDSAVYNHDLARLCSQFTVVGYTSGDGNGNGKNTVVKKALKKLGFDNPKVSLSEGRTSVNYFIADKPIIVNGEEYTLIFMGFIGSYHDQWYSNFDPKINSVTHDGFERAAASMKLVLAGYIEDMNLDKTKTKFLITGHSRGAATANLVAADLIKNEQYAYKENIYTYAFATPNSTSLPERNNTEYARIFNVVNPEDFVTKVLPSTWKYEESIYYNNPTNYGRYGTTYVLPSRTNTDTNEYLEYVDKMQQYFYVLTNGETYEPYESGEFGTYYAVKSLTKEVKNLEEFYTVPLSAGSKDLTPYEFFQNTLCHFVSKTASESELAKAAAIIIGTLFSENSSRAYLDILDYFIVYSFSTEDVKLSGVFEDAHRAETYCSYMMSMAENQLIYEERLSFLNTVNCPVDIEIIDNKTGEVVGRIVNNIVDEEIAAKENAIVMSVDGDSKSFWLPSNGDYTVKLIGNGEGTMDYTVAEIDPDLGEQERVNFFDVEITEGKEFTGDVPAYDFEIDEYTLKTDSGEEIPDEKLDAESGEITITTSVEGDGYVTEIFNVKSGDYVTVSAQPFVTAKFVKWVDSSGNTLSTDAEYSFVAKENTSIKAVFTTASGLNIQNPSTTTVNYGDTLILHADFGDAVLPEGYTILWTVEGAGFNTVVSEDGLTCNVTSVANGNATVTATLVDENGEAVLDADGNEISDNQELKSNAGFFQKLISFFKNLFRIPRVIPQ